LQDSDRPEQRLYEALSHPIRRKILRLIAEQGFTTYSDLIAELELTPGSLYHHLGSLKDLVVQDEEKRYRFSSLGARATKLLDTGTGYVATNPAQNMLEVRRNPFFEIFSFQSLITTLNNAPIHSILESILIIGLLGWLSSSMNTVVAGYIILFKKYSFPISLLAVIASCGTLFLFFEGGSRYLFTRPQEIRGIWFITVISFLPQTIFLGIWYLLFRFLELTSISSTMALVIITCLQFWSLLIQVVNLRRIKKLAMEKALVLALGALYANFLILWALNLI